MTSTITAEIAWKLTGKGAGGTASPPGRPFREIDVKALAVLRAQGLSWRAIEQRTGIPKSVAQRRVGAAGAVRS